MKGIRRRPRGAWFVFLVAGALPAAAVGPGCTVITVRYGHPVPSAEAVQAITPGTSTEAEVVAALGVPEEYVSSNALGAGRSRDPPRQRVVEERDLFDRRVLNWVRETRISNELTLLPKVPLIGGLVRFFHYERVEHAFERVVVLLDERGVVTAAGRTVETLP